MVSNGYSRKCIQVFRSVHKSIVVAGYEQVGIERMSNEDVQQLEWQDVVGLINQWVQATLTSIRVLFVSKRLLSENTFEALELLLWISFLNSDSIPLTTSPSLIKIYEAWTLTKFDGPFLKHQRYVGEELRQCIIMEVERILKILSQDHCPLLMVAAKRKRSSATPLTTSMKQGRQF
ncbi:hypothetical protein AMTR_s00131p00110750 [Amborella trichopoda]|uniref:Uncharacterized protein n=1 Tax=Amborella trichopoda TaxID=13333 RepID=W1NXP7_AMBTC|nr:hypothetical protein AMTR_s00131p00110750 [Amborella trichopoda]